MLSKEYLCQHRDVADLYLPSVLCPWALGLTSSQRHSLVFSFLCVENMLDAFRPDSFGVLLKMSFLWATVHYFRHHGVQKRTPYQKMRWKEVITLESPSLMLQENERKPADAFVLIKANIFILEIMILSSRNNIVLGDIV